MGVPTAKCAGVDPARRAAKALTLALGAAFLARAVIGPVVESLRAELWLTDQALGTLQGGFSGAYAAALPASAALAARRNGSRVLAGALLLCGAGTLLSGAAIGFWSLLAARVLAGAGAGAATALAAGLLGHVLALSRMRTGALLLATTPVGLAAGYLLGGTIGSWPGWRPAFVVAGLAVTAAALACWRLDGSQRVGGGGPWETLRAVGLLPALRLAVAEEAGPIALAGVAAGAFGAGGLAFWLPVFLERARDTPRAAAAVQLAAAVLMTGATGIMAGRWLVDRLARHVRDPERWAAAAVALGASAALATAFASGLPGVYLPALVVGLLCLFAWMRCTFAAFSGDAAGTGPTALIAAALATHGLGDLLAAPALGALSEGASFGRAVTILPAALLASAVLWGVAAWRRGRAASSGARVQRERDVA